MVNRQSIINYEVTDCLDQGNINCEMHSPTQEEEVKEAVGQLSNGKAPEADAIPAEVNKAGSPPIISKLTELFQSFWERGQIFQEVKYASIIHLYNRKGYC